MKLSKRLCLLLCVSLAACSSVDEKAEQAKAKAEREAKPVVAVEPAKPDAKWLERYETNLRDALKGSPFEVERREDLIAVIAPVKGTFNPDRPGMLLPATLGPITQVAKMLEKDPETAAVILGHGDGIGDEAAGVALSLERARAFAAIFRLSGLKHDRLQTRGLGGEMPRSTSKDVVGHALNRRVEILLTPQTRFALLAARYQAPAAKAVVDGEAAQVAVVDEKLGKAAK